jgi:hypothetical protein
MLTDFESVNAVCDLAVLARLLDAWTEIGVLQRDAVFVAARGSDNLGGRNGTVGVDPVAPPPTVGGGRVGDLFAVAVSRCWREFSHCEPRAGVDSLAGLYQFRRSEKAALGRFGCPDEVQVGSHVSQAQAAFVTTLAGTPVTFGRPLVTNSLRNKFVQW